MWSCSTLKIPGWLYTAWRVSHWQYPSVPDAVWSKARSHRRYWAELNSTKLNRSSSERIQNCEVRIQLGSLRSRRCELAWARCVTKLTRRKRVCKTQGVVYWTKVGHIFIRRWAVIGCINARIHIAVLLSIFDETRQKSVAIATFLKRSEKEAQINHAYPHLCLSWKFGKYRSTIFWDHWSPIGDRWKITINNSKT